jgi:hypothetical protein
MANLTSREHRFLSLLTPAGATISVGLSVGATLKRKGYVTLAKFGRLGITEAGRQALLEAPQEPKPRGRNAPQGRGNSLKTPAGGRGNTGQATPSNGGMGQGELPLF